MADTERTETDPRGQLFDHLEEVRAGMLGVEGSHQHMQPMTHHIDREPATLWFITASDTDLVRALTPNSMAHFCVQSTSQDFYACLKGHLEVVEDEKKLDDIWSRIAAAWFEEGRDDDKVTLLRMSLKDASIWSSGANPVTFGLEVLKANMTKGTADIGAHNVVNFASAA